TVIGVPADVAFGSGAGAPARVNVYKPDGNFRTTIFPTDPNYSDRTGIRVAAADFNGDGVTDIVMGTGPGAVTLVTVIDGATRQTLFKVQPFETSFTGGLFVAAGDVDGNGAYVAAGDVNGDGFADLIGGGGPGGGPRVFAVDGHSLLQNGTGTLLPVANFFAGDIENRGGIRVAVKDIDGDNKADIITGA